jgi:guanosine-3',5'-bis(diphosphate) 3'-pyrophosphohydrolase
MGVMQLRSPEVRTDAVDLSHLLDAVNFAASKHRCQRRKDAEASPYVNHPIAVAHLLATRAGVRDLMTLQAAILHDTIEDTDTCYEELAACFGKEVADIVAEVTDDKSVPKAERKRLQIKNAPNKSQSAALVKLADKTCNLRDILESPPSDWSSARKREYFDWAKGVVDLLPAVNPALKLEFDLLYGRAVDLT